MLRTKENVMDDSEPGSLVFVVITVSSQSVPTSIHVCTYTLGQGHFPPEMPDSNLEAICRPVCMTCVLKGEEKFLGVRAFSDHYLAIKASVSHPIISRTESRSPADSEAISCAFFSVL